MTDIYSVSSAILSVFTRRKSSDGGPGQVCIG